ncbi:Carboxypeptidase S1 [Psilocybe cubensis]|uniref:Carboxypeptidase S1 n=2 Tax=Psilocybe cubensis TaxID=181762 RepID=A0ACB8GVK1_PSICU|nr:Carboxypeptidase S1 [Psilocybe cubensis]KAH9479646.1 Carboxypeptidase S1 [Psilocybe cubensis]
MGQFGIACIRVISVLVALASFVQATPVLDVEQKAIFTRFASVNNPDVSLRFVSDSGVCETTPGVHQMSGYIDVGTNMSMWFWFFESRESPETAPFTLWLNGGPGCSSMIGLFQENGPCQVNPDGATTVLNPFSWNNISNMIYIDQPIGTGFSFGTDTVNSTLAASPFVWQAFQVLFESNEFAKYQSREFIFATESYGGHYGPAMVTFFDQQNALIKAGALKGELVTISALMINNGWYDPLIQNKAYVDFAFNAPGYGQLQPDNVLAKLNQSYFEPGGCKDQEEACYAAGTGPDSDAICKKADNFCVENVFSPAVGNRDSDDLRQNASSPNPFPPEFYLNFLKSPTVKAKIGAESTYHECANAPFNLFSTTGDDARTLLPQLGALANSTLKILLWAGDADINCNWLGGHASALAMDWYGAGRLAATPFTNMTINGVPVAAIQNVDNFSFARVFQAGHEVPAFQPQAALEIFRQVINMEQLHSV